MILLLEHEWNLDWKLTYPLDVIEHRIYDKSYTAKQHTEVREKKMGQFKLENWYLIVFFFHARRY